MTGMGSEMMRTSEKMLMAAWANQSALKSTQVPEMGRFQKRRMGVQLKTLRRMASKA